MGRYFGTDGFRGKVNQTLMAEHAYKVGRYIGYYYSTHKKGKILIGKDTRLSGSMLENALACGASASGCDVRLLGVCPTPAVAYLVRQNGYDCGIMISASHNPYYDNGIKIFSHDGFKIDSSLEALIEDYIDDLTVIPYAKEDRIGQIEADRELLKMYLDYLKAMFSFDLTNFKIVCDLANGSSVATAVEVLESFHAKLTVISDEPNGVNINTHCGSTHPERLIEIMKTGSYDLGLAFDGDADRLIAVDDKGELVNGDKLLFVLGTYMKEKGQLKDDTLVTTVMANLGLYHILDAMNIRYCQTAVGDKYVHECLVENGYKLGGEQSGHVIFPDLATTGDGLLTALKLLEVIAAKKKPLSELTKPLFIYPQLLVNALVNDRQAVIDDPSVLRAIERIQKELNDDGRILVRPSGTEPLIRVMVEAQTDELCHRYVYEIIDLIKEKGL